MHPLRKKYSVDDSIDSWAFFDRTFHCSSNNSPIMSRRVFDVGLDVDRIKNGLRLHSVNRRNKNHRSASVSYTQSEIPAENQFAVVPHLKEKRSDPTLQKENGRPLSTGEDTPAALPPANSPKIQDTLQPAPQSPTMNSNHAPSEDYMEPLHTPLDDDAQNFDLRPPPPKKSVKFLESFTEQLFSSDHLRTILQDPTYFIRFTAFLNRYRPNSTVILTRWLEAQKAIKAVEYANALAESFKPMPGEQSSQGPCPAAALDKTFETRSRRALEALVDDCLSAYVTQAFTKVVTESMVREITGSTMPAIRDLVGGLAEVFCLSDPSQRDNPIIYASEEFYRTTQYGRDYVLGRNCRFLQGPRTDRTTIARIRDAVKTGQESSETILNYRRDGSPFVNLVMTAPLYDNKGVVRYFIGAQVDISGLVEEGRGLDSFEKYINEHRRNRNANNQSSTNHKFLKVLGEFGQMLSVEESHAIHASKGQSREGSVNESEHGSSRSNRGAQNRCGDPNVRQTRRVLGNEDTEDEQSKDRDAWAFTSLGPSGKLPGVYQNVCDSENPIQIHY